MSFLSGYTIFCPRSSGSLCALLTLLLLLLAQGPLAEAGPVMFRARELRCVCVSTIPGILPRMITNPQVIPAGPQCPKMEVIATHKNLKKQVCLDPEAPWVKKFIQKSLKSESKKLRKAS